MRQILRLKVDITKNLGKGGKPIIRIQTCFTAGQTMETNAKGKKVGLSLVYPPPNLYHILFELFKNSMRATVEIHGKSHKLPMIEVLVAKGEHDVSIRVSDQVRPPYTGDTDILCARC